MKSLIERKSSETLKEISNEPRKLIQSERKRHQNKEQEINTSFRKRLYSLDIESTHPLITQEVKYLTIPQITTENELSMSTILKVILPINIIQAFENYFGPEAIFSWKDFLEKTSE